MKKHNEGYVLAFVLIVVAVLTLISTAVSTVAVRNIETQQAAVKRMQDKYKAEGAIEKIVAELSGLEVTETEEKMTADSAKLVFEEKLKEVCIRYNSSEGKLPQSVTTSLENDMLTCTLTVESANDSSLVKTEIKMVSEVLGINGKYTVAKPVFTYTSYEISTQTTEPSEGGAAG